MLFRAPADGSSMQMSRLMPATNWEKLPLSLRLKSSHRSMDKRQSHKYHVCTHLQRLLLTAIDLHPRNCKTFVLCSAAGAVQPGDAGLKLEILLDARQCSCYVTMCLISPEPVFTSDNRQMLPLTKSPMLHSWCLPLAASTHVCITFLDTGIRVMKALQAEHWIAS